MLHKALSITAITLLICEITLRCMGEPTWPADSPERIEKKRFEPDAELGWRKRPGVHDLGTPEHPERYTFLPGNLRATSAGQREGEDVFLLGCSFSEGAGLSDNQTYAWKLQERLPNLRVLNFATSAYGTYQSLLTLEKAYAAHGGANTVIYGFIDFHHLRNVAHWEWWRGLAWGSSMGLVAVPYCLMGEGGMLQCFPPTMYPRWPLRSSSALVTFIDKVWVSLTTRDRISQAHDVTIELIKRMRQTAESHGSRFLLVYLHSNLEPKEIYLKRFDSIGIEFIDCINPRVQSNLEEFVIPSIGHPNEKLTEYWADCIGNYLDKR